jgi:hypothetical protein
MKKHFVAPNQTNAPNKAQILNSEDSKAAYIRHTENLKVQN